MSRLDDGYQTLISFSANTAVELWEKSVTPPGMSAGGAIDTTTMHNTRWRTFKGKALATLTAISATCAYDPAVYESILAMLGVNQEITITFPDGSTLEFWGILDEFTPGENTEGEQPTATITITPTNQDNSEVEQAPVYLSDESN